VSISPVYVFSYLVAIGVGIILSIFFLLEYRRKKLHASLAWGLGFLLYWIAQSVDLSTLIFGEPVVGRVALWAGLTIAWLSIVLFYYGASLLFFSPASFFRERFTVAIAVICLAFFTYTIATFPLVGFRDVIRPYVQLLVSFPVFIVISYFFFRTSRRLASDDPRRQTVILVAFGWFINALYAVFFAEFQGLYSTVDVLFYLLHATAWILLLFGMRLAKVSRT
jgi:hypothetical protein